MIASSLLLLIFSPYWFEHTENQEVYVIDFSCVQGLAFTLRSGV